MVYVAGIDIGGTKCAVTIGSVSDEGVTVSDKIRMQIKLAEDAGETKKKVEYENIDKDLNDYEMNVLYPLAIQHLTFDLDDGVKVNYQKLGKALKAIK